MELIFGVELNFYNALSYAVLLFVCVKLCFYILANLLSGIRCHDVQYSFVETLNEIHNMYWPRVFKRS